MCGPYVWRLDVDTGNLPGCSYISLSEAGSHSLHLTNTASLARKLALGVPVSTLEARITGKPPCPPGGYAASVVQALVLLVLLLVQQVL